MFNFLRSKKTTEARSFSASPSSLRIQSQINLSMFCFLATILETAEAVVVLSAFAMLARSQLNERKTLTGTTRIYYFLPCNNARNGAKVKQNNNAIVILLDIIGAKIENLLITLKC